MTSSSRPGVICFPKGYAVRVEEPTRHPLLARLHTRRERHLQRSRLYRVGFAVAGFALTIVGLVLWLFPVVPGGALTFVGLAMLALEFAWAEKLLAHSLRLVERVRRRFGKRRAPKASGEGSQEEAA